MTRRRRFYARFGNEDAKIKGIISNGIVSDILGTFKYTDMNLT
jgi:hypothetical protein